MAKIAAACIVFRIPIVGQFHHRNVGLRRAHALWHAAHTLDIFRRGQENQREPSGLTVHPADLFQAQPLTEEFQRRVDIADTHHSVQILNAHVWPPLRSRMTCLKVGGISA